MDFITLYLYLGLLVLGMVTALWVVSVWLKDSSIVDIFWGTGFVVVAWAAFFLTPDEFMLRKWLVVGLVTVWGLRLSLHLLARNWGKGEDFRYQVWRKEAGNAWWWRSYFKVFLLQGAIMWIVAAPLAAAQLPTVVSPGFFREACILGGAVVLWAVGFFFEAAGDWQLMRFKANPANRGKVLNTGVWRYTRHPNYFGDSLQWVGFYLLAVAAGAWWTVFSPLIMAALLMRVSGVTLLEKSLKDAKPGYREYIETTSEFLPWFPKKKKKE